jgi:hypothetical protein
MEGKGLPSRMTCRASMILPWAVRSTYSLMSICRGQATWQGGIRLRSQGAFFGLVSV